MSTRAQYSLGYAKLVLILLVCAQMKVDILLFTGGKTIDCASLRFALLRALFAYFSSPAAYHCDENPSYSVTMWQLERQIYLAKLSLYPGRSFLISKDGTRSECGDACDAFLLAGRSADEALLIEGDRIEVSPGTQVSIGVARTSRSSCAIVEILHDNEEEAADIRRALWQAKAPAEQVDEVGLALDDTFEQSDLAAIGTQEAEHTKISLQRRRVQCDNIRSPYELVTVYNDVMRLL
ncbi:MAG: hypothetical protein MHM6MM_007469 [Cercozoa sp. M6MM]